jgi:hypothetical protein
MARQRQETGKGSSRRRISQRLLLMILGREPGFVRTSESVTQVRPTLF